MSKYRSAVKLVRRLKQAMVTHFEPGTGLFITDKPAAAKLDDMGRATQSKLMDFTKLNKIINVRPGEDVGDLGSIDIDDVRDALVRYPARQGQNRTRSMFLGEEAASRVGLRFPADPRLSRRARVDQRAPGKDPRITYALTGTAPPEYARHALQSAVERGLTTSLLKNVREQAASDPSVGKLYQASRFGRQLLAPNDIDRLAQLGQKVKMYRDILQSPKTNPESKLDIAPEFDRLWSEHSRLRSQVIRGLERGELTPTIRTNRRRLH